MCVFLVALKSVARFKLPRFTESLDISNHLHRARWNALMVRAKASSGN